MSPGEIDRIEAKIAAAEQITSAQIRVAVVRPSWFGIKRKARKIFEQQGLGNTRERNAVLVLVDFRSHEILIYGDEGVNSRAGDDFWTEVRDAMVEEFRARRPADGLVIGVRMIGERLSQIFPANGRETNALSNALIFE